MDIAKFCPATQGWSTHESTEPDLLLRLHPTKQEGDHAAEGPRNAIALAASGKLVRGVNRLMVKSGKSRMASAFR
jgi:hypothetical protein